MGLISLPAFAARVNEPQLTLYWRSLSTVILKRLPWKEERKKSCLDGSVKTPVKSNLQLRIMKDPTFLLNCAKGTNRFQVISRGCDVSKTFQS